jgi:hypothetical protein
MTEKIEKGAKGYAPCWPFRVEYTGEEWKSMMGPIVEIYWDNFIAPFWDGTVKIRIKK